MLHNIQNILRILSLRGAHITIIPSGPKMNTINSLYLCHTTRFNLIICRRFFASCSRIVCVQQGYRVPISHFQLASGSVLHKWLLRIDNRNANVLTHFAFHFIDPLIFTRSLFLFLDWLIRQYSNMNEKKRRKFLINLRYGRNESYSYYQKLRFFFLEHRDCLVTKQW